MKHYEGRDFKEERTKTLEEVDLLIQDNKVS